MDTYLYLLLCLVLLVPCGAIYALRRDLRRKMIKASIVTAVAAVAGEYWHLKDYWQPPTTVGVGVVSPEDALFGIAVGGLAVSLFDAARGTTDAPGARPRRALVLTLFLAGLASLFVFTTALDMNSLLVSIAGFLVATVIMLALRPDLLPVALVSAGLLGILTFCIYLILFTWLAPHYWYEHWLLAGTPLGIMVFDIPVTEIAWYASWGLLAGIIPNVASGTVKVAFFATSRSPRDAR